MLYLWSIRFSPLLLLLFLCFMFLFICYCVLCTCPNNSYGKRDTKGRYEHSKLIKPITSFPEFHPLVKNRVCDGFSKGDRIPGTKFASEELRKNPNGFNPSIYNCLLAHVCIYISICTSHSQKLLHKKFRDGSPQKTLSSANNVAAMLLQMIWTASTGSAGACFAAEIFMKICTSMRFGHSSLLNIQLRKLQPWSGIHEPWCFVVRLQFSKGVVHHVFIIPRRV